MTDPELIAHLVRACDTLKRMSFPKNGAPPSVDRALGAHGPEPIHERWDYASDKTKLNVTRPSAEDISHFDRWWPLILSVLDQRTQAHAIVIGRCWGYPWAKVARKAGCDYRTARARYDMAIRAIGRHVRTQTARRYDYAVSSSGRVA